ncbi:MAG TPA: hypothetical protein PKN04_02755 [bacterium]|nr:hypothetical protein [bacterium]HNT64674.1 hypothetical protein [bacterium]HOX85835.1 hypothetical protein [bacterium]HPG45182.1 hypothetical protein [bacterium]HPM97424.1 hypothetical protein [bacterium]
MNTFLAKNIVYPLIGRARGEKTVRVLREIRSVPLWAPDEIEALQRHKLLHVLHLAQESIPHYQQSFERTGIDVRLFKAPKDLDNIPILTKESVRKNIDRLCNPNQRTRKSCEVTSGTSGQPLMVIKDRHKSAYIRAVMFRGYEQFGISYGDKQVRFWGVPSKRKSFYIEKLKDILANRIRLSAFHMRADEMSRFLRTMVEFKPDYFYGYPSALSRFAQWIQEKGLSLHGLKLSVIISTGEVLYPLQRQLIENLFQCHVANEYGTTEAGVLAFECPQGQLHINSDHVLLQIQPLNGQTGAGRILLTELNNDYNPLIRYDVGDIGSISPQRCTCGNNFPLLAELHGRQSSFIVTPENDYVNDAILEYILRTGVHKFQGIQKDKHDLTIKVVKNKDWTSKLYETYVHQLKKALGQNMRIEFQFVDSIDFEESGKFRYFISHLL